MPRAPVSKNSARSVAARAIADAARSFPDIDAQPINVERLDPRDTRLALAIHRTVLQRWLTLDYVLNLYLRKPLRTMEPPLQGVLLTAAAQLLFMDRLPAHAVVDESVKLARAMVRPGAAGLVNAVLRRVSELPDRAVEGKPWGPAEDRLPLETGYVPLRDACLPAVGESSNETPGHELHDLEKHLAAATSHPVQLVRPWLKEHGPAQAIELCSAGLRTPPVIVAVEQGFKVDRGASESPGDSPWEPHIQPGFILWHGPHSELTAFLRGHPARRVQDPTSAAVVAAAVHLSPKVVLDYCAGRGTKTRQLLATFSEAAIVATDTDDDRRGVLHGAFEREARVRVVKPPEIRASLASATPAGLADLLLLDVPCTNTGVLARRPEARYRFNEATLKSLVRLQRSIIEKSLPLLAPGGHLLYSTCSIDRHENQNQTRWVVEQFKLVLETESLTLPGGAGAGYHDGGYVALLRRPS